MGEVIAQASDRSGWMSARVGRFTASTFGELISEDSARLKRKEKVGDVVFGGTALTRIRKVAMQRITGLEENSPNSAQTERGESLEAVALAVLHLHWKPVSRSAFIELGDFAGASPDFVTDEGEATGDIKCPWNPEKLMEFAALPDGDHDALKEYDAKYYWQIMMQAYAAGVKVAYLVFFDDRQPLMEVDATQILEETGHHIPSSKCVWVVKRYELTQDVSDRIKNTLAAAEYLCQHYEAEYRNVFAAQQAEVEPLDEEVVQARFDALVDYGWQRDDAQDGTPILVLDGAQDVPIADIPTMPEEKFHALLSSGLDSVLRVGKPIAEDPPMPEEQHEPPQPVVDEPLTDLAFMGALKAKYDTILEELAERGKVTQSAILKRDVKALTEKTKYCRDMCWASIKDLK